MKTKTILVTLAVLCLITPVSAEECNKPLKLFASLPMTDRENDDRVTIPVSISGVEKQFLFDTGGFFTQISPALVDELKLKKSEAYGLSSPVYGTSSQGSVFIPDFAIGPLHGENYRIPISPFREFDGIFSPVAFEAVDFEMDFSARKLGMFSNDHCDGKVVYWPSKAFGVVPFTVDHDQHIMVPVIIDGHEAKAMIDTGADTSLILLNKATEKVFDLHPDSPDMMIVGHVGNNQNQLTFSHSFKSLSFGNVVVSNPHIQIYTDVAGGSVIPRFDYYETLSSSDVVIGMDVLRKLHLFLALKEHKLYLTEASAPASTTPAPTPASAPAAAPANGPK
jgi:hypothetical protein